MFYIAHARHFAEQSLKQTVVVENRPGAGTVIGAEAVKNAPADGYTFLLSGSSTQAANPSSNTGSATSTTAKISPSTGAS